MYDILADKYLSKTATPVLVVCNKQGRIFILSMFLCMVPENIDASDIQWWI